MYFAILWGGNVIFSYIFVLAYFFLWFNFLWLKGWVHEVFTWTLSLIRTHAG